MVRRDEIRAAERAIAWDGAEDAGLVFVGRIHTLWVSRMSCPRQGRADGPTCRIEVFGPWVDALDGIAEYEWLEVLYWLHRSRRDLVRRVPLGARPAGCAWSSSRRRRWSPPQWWRLQVWSAGPG